MMMTMNSTELTTEPWQHNWRARTAEGHLPSLYLARLVCETDEEPDAWWPEGRPDETEHVRGVLAAAGIGWVSPVVFMDQQDGSGRGAYIYFQELTDAGWELITHLAARKGNAYKLPLQHGAYWKFRLNLKPGYVAADQQQAYARLMSHAVRRGLETLDLPLDDDILDISTRCLTPADLLRIAECQYEEDQDADRTAIDGHLADLAGGTPGIAERRVLAWWTRKPCYDRACCASGGRT